MKCRACKREHSPLLSCDRALRLDEFHASKAAEAKPVAAVLKPVLTSPKPKPVLTPKDRHAPGYMAEYMREYRAKRRAAAKALKGATK